MSRLKKPLAALVAGLLMAIGLSVVTSAPASAAAANSLYGPYQIRSLTNYNKCLDVTGVSQSNGALLQMYDCLGASQTNQVFYFWKVEGTADYYAITPSHSWKCLDIVGASTANGALLQQYSCLGTSQTNQVFQVAYDSNAGGYTIVPTHSWRPVNRYNDNNGASVYQQYQYIWGYWGLQTV